MNKAGSHHTRENRHNNTKNNEGRNISERQAYIQGNAVKKLQEVPKRKRQINKGNNTATKRITKQKSIAMNNLYVGAMIISIVMICIVLMSYIGLQSSITNHVNNISKLESELYELRLSNDEMYTKIISSVDLEEIKRIAVNELGMKYAKEGQVVTYSGEGNDYVRQYDSLPD